uniref:Uncharacterized protein n=1 Tax=Mycena chlorophos TaxID=658473 RepID=A0ABQ0MG86_MYCCL|nr:predicted protein [Mycena chlorophos]
MSAAAASSDRLVGVPQPENAEQPGHRVIFYPTPSTQLEAAHVCQLAPTVDIRDQPHTTKQKACISLQWGQSPVRHTHLEMTVEHVAHPARYLGPLIE